MYANTMQTVKCCTKNLYTHIQQTVFRMYGKTAYKPNDYINHAMYMYVENKLLGNLNSLV